MRTALAAAAAILVLLAACASQPEKAMQAEERSKRLCQDYGQDYACASYDGNAWTAVCIQRNPTRVVRHELE